ncbi:MAG: DUF4097 domain-containing protein [Oscillospiraceae bacterium]|nr:DUF4097 domain-containing protein [Oscillospiraceae bacterium]
MRKIIAGICILISILMVGLLVTVMVSGMRGNSFGFFNRGRSSVSFFEFGGTSELVKEDSVSMDGVRKLELSARSHAIYVRSVNSNTLTVRQYGPNNLSDRDYFDLRKNGDYVTVDARSEVRSRIVFFGWTVDERIEIDVPSDWIGDVDIDTSSGGLKIQDTFEWGDISIKCTSGGITVERKLTGNKVDIRVSSGGIRLNDSVIADSVYIKSTSGGIRTDYIEARTVEADCSSGGITFGNTVKADDVNMRTTSGSLKAETLDAGNFNISSSSGGVRITELIGQGYVKCSSGGINIAFLNPTGNVELRTTSGGIRTEVPRDLKHLVSTHASSGGVTVDER